VSGVSEPFIRRPVATSLLMIGLLTAGSVALRTLPISAFPQVDYPTIVVSTNLPGASADTMASSVTTPLEEFQGTTKAFRESRASKPVLILAALITVYIVLGILYESTIHAVTILSTRDQGITPIEAIRQACLLQFRPIMMTTAAALFGGVPLAFGTGVGSEFRRPPGISIVCGPPIFQVFTLYTTPVVHLALDRIARWLRRGKPAPSAALAPAPR